MRYRWLYGAFLLLAVVAIDTWIAVGTTKANAEAGRIKLPPGVYLLKLKTAQQTFWLDADAGGEVSAFQVGT